LTSAPATTPPPAVPQAREIPPRSEVLSEQAPPAAPSSAASSATAPASTTPPIPQRRESILSGSPFERQLLAAPAESFSLQILGASSEANVKAFVERNGNGLRQTLGYYRAERAGAPWYIVAYGVFATRAEAEATLNRLPQALAASGPWVRSISAVQAEIRASR
jgi:DamX protein